MRTKIIQLQAKNILSIARDTLQIELETLAALRDSLGHEFEEVVRLIFQSEGRLVVTGVGKSALVAQKIVATLNSTGTPALFMHAADAIHGDLGMIKSADIVLCLSKSGSTAEMRVLIPFIKNLGNTTISMTSKADSFLAEQSDYHLWTPVSQEADPNNLAPTASSTAQIALGDALAMSLLSLRGFSPKDFARFHPGGTLGKQLYLRIQDIYIQNEKPQVLVNANIQEIILEISSKRLGITAVLNPKGELQGVITDGDLRRMLEKHQVFSAITAQQIMTPNPRTVNTNLLAVKALELMRTNSITQLIVVHEKQYLGVIHLHDLIREGLV